MASRPMFLALYVGSLDHLVCTGEYTRRNRETDLFSSFEIYHQLEFRRLLNGKIAGSSTFQDSVHVSGGATEQVGEVGSIEQEPAPLLRMLSCVINPRKPFLCREVCDLSPIGKDRWVWHHKSAGPFPNRGLKSA